MRFIVIKRKNKHKFSKKLTGSIDNGGEVCYTMQYKEAKRSGTGAFTPGTA